MTKLIGIVGLAAVVVLPRVSSQTLDDAEVRLPYGELKELLAKAAVPAKPAAEPPVLLAARLRVVFENEQVVIEGRLRAASFSAEPAWVSLLGGDVSLAAQEPGEAVVAGDGKSLRLFADRAGVHALELRLLAVTKPSFSIHLPPCPGAILEAGDLPAGRALSINTGNGEEWLGAGETRPLPPNGGTIVVRTAEAREASESLRPPEPSEWTWQNQTVVRAVDDWLQYLTISQAAAAGGSGVDAMLALPADARDVQVEGEDLVSFTKIRGDNRELALKLVWKSRGVLDRQVTISYRLPLRPLDRRWELQAPGGEGARTRFLLVSSPVLAFRADGLSQAVTAQGLPAVLAAVMDGMPVHHLEAGHRAEVEVTSVPVVVTATGVVKQAEWIFKVEPDGAMLASGSYVIEHNGPLDFIFDTPPGMKLLTCELGGKPVAPVDLGDGALKLVLPPQGAKSALTCGFTGRADALDPVEGTLKLALPKTPVFVEALMWHLDLPAGYQAETHGNLARQQPSAGGPPSRITLRKNLARDERPEVQVFYQRANLNR